MGVPGQRGGELDARAHRALQRQRPRSAGCELHPAGVQRLQQRGSPRGGPEPGQDGHRQELPDLPGGGIRLGGAQPVPRDQRRGPAGWGRREARAGTAVPPRGVSTQPA